MGAFRNLCADLQQTVDIGEVIGEIIFCGNFIMSRILKGFHEDRIAPFVFFAMHSHICLFLGE